MVVMSNTRELDLADLPERVLKFTGIGTPIVFSAPTAVNAESAVHSDRRLNVEIGMSMEEIKEEAIRATLEYVGNNRAKAAKILGVNKRTIFRKIKEYDLCDD
jgi:two-component system response regulator HydG